MHKKVSVGVGNKMEKQSKALILKAVGRLKTNFRNLASKLPTKANAALKKETTLKLRNALNSPNTKVVKGVFNKQSSYKSNKMSFTQEFFKLGYELEKQAMEKTSGAVSEVVGTMLNPINSGFAPIGGLVGLLESDSEKRFKDLEESAVLSNLLVPGVGAYRLGTRLRAAIDHKGK